MYLLEEGNKIEAIKLYREETGAGLKEAKDAVEAVGRGSVFLSVENRDEADDDKLRELLRSGQKIQAIKLYRERTGVGLKEAKDAVERLQAQLGLPVARGSGCLSMVFPALLAITVERLLRLLS